MEAAYFEWMKGAQPNTALNILLITRMAAAYYEGGLYEQAIRNGKAALELIKSTDAKTWEEKRRKTQNYLDVFEALAMSYQKTGRPDEAARTFAEVRDLAFSLPSASFYHRIKTLAAKAGLKDPEATNSAPPTGPCAPDLAISEWLGAPPASLASYRGKVVLLDFWATWCGPCIASFPRLRDLQARYGSQGFVILGITNFEGKKNNKPVSRREELKFLSAFKEKHDLRYPVAISDATDAGWSKYGINAIPTTFLIDRRGIIRHIGVGSGKEEAARLEEMIKKVVAEKN
jgi:thiol-disulfide isomerase/thioredoxin